MYKNNSNFGFDNHGNYNHENSSDYQSGYTNNDRIVNEQVSFTSGTLHITSQDLRSVNIGAAFSGVVIYLDKANIQDSAHLNFNLAFGGAEIYVPKHWNVIVSSIQCFAGIDSRNRNDNQVSENAPTLYIHGSIAFGGLQINYI